MSHPPTILHRIPVDQTGEILDRTPVAGRIPDGGGSRVEHVRLVGDPIEDHELIAESFDDQVRSADLSHG
jgi:hypothetical protein